MYDINIYQEIITNILTGQIIIFNMNSSLYDKFPKFTNDMKNYLEIII